jgi:hypothetical protein
MTIHQGNIEAYLLDYLEGNLDPLLTAELMAFMAENPGYEKWLPEYDGRLCVTDGTSFEHKFSLKKDFGDIPEINPENFEEFCIASMEGLLQAGDESRLQDYLALQPEKQSEYSLFHRLKLEADTSLTYPGKARLKKPVRRVVPLRFIYYALGAAASVALMLLLTSRKPPVRNYSVALPARSGTVTRESQSSLPGKTLEVSPGVQARKIRKSSRTPETPGPADTAAVSRETTMSGILPLASLQPIREISLASGQQVPGMSVIKRRNAPASEKKNASAFSQETEPSPLQFLSSAIKKLNFWKAAETAVTGFNYLTESQLSLSKTTDENGKLTRLGISTEQFIISGNKTK